MTNRHLNVVIRNEAFHFLSRVDLGRCELVNRKWSAYIEQNATTTLPLYVFPRLDLGSGGSWKRIVNREYAYTVEEFRTRCPGSDVCEWESIINHYLGLESTKKIFASVVRETNNDISTQLIVARSHISADRGKREGLHDLIHFLADATPSDRVYFADVSFNSFDGYAFLYYLLYQPLDGWNRLGSGGFRTEQAHVQFDFNEVGEARRMVDCLLRGGHFCRRQLIVVWESRNGGVAENIEPQAWLDEVARVPFQAITDMSEKLQVRDIGIYVRVSPGARETTKGRSYTQFRGSHSGIVLRLFKDSFKASLRGFGRNSTAARTEKKQKSRETKRKGIPLI